MSIDVTSSLGKIIPRDADAQRDAIHIAVIPMISRYPLEPGEAVILDPKYPDSVKGRRYADYEDKSKVLGVVDPFLRSTVLPLERFWLFLNPGSITSLRHDWTHPAFTRGDEGSQGGPVGPTAEERRAEALEKLENAAAGYGGRPWLIRLMSEYNEFGCLGDDTPAMPEITQELWDAWEVVTGLKAEHPDEYFRCAC